MSDTERVVEIIRVMGMNNIQFSQRTGISPASLSHITSGRSNPTLTILRNIVQSFPELNPEWVLLGTGNMFKDSVDENQNATQQNSENETATSTSAVNMNKEGGLFDNEDFAPSFDFGSSPSPQPDTNRQSAVRQGVAGRTEQRYPAEMQGVKSSNAIRSSSHAALNMGGNIDITDVVRATVSQFQRPQRKVKEVHIYFDDGTYEIFGPARKVE